MPHVLVKMIEGRSEEKKKELAEKLTEVVVSVLGSNEGSVSVAIVDIAQDRWEPDVFLPEIKGQKKDLYKKPGYASVD